MRYEIILFRFTSPVHFGDAAEGGDLGEILSYCRADTFFSALCREAADISQELLACVVEGVQRGKLRFSDLFPWKKRKDCNELYLPRPVMNISHDECGKTLSYEEVREQSAERKKKRSALLSVPRKWSLTYRGGIYLPSLILGKKNYVRNTTPEKNFPMGLADIILYLMPDYI